MKNIIILLVLLSVSFIGYPQEIITGTENEAGEIVLSEEGIDILNEELRKINQGIVLPSGALFFMVTGECPSESTDVTSTYSGKFVRANATGGSTGGADTDTVPTHVLIEAEMPAHVHNAAGASGGSETLAPEIDNIVSGGQGNEKWQAVIQSTGGGTAHGHGSVDTVPSFVTAKYCQVD